MSKENPADTAARENLEKQRKNWRGPENLLLTVLCAAFFVGLTLLFFILPHASYSKTENRGLARMPELTVPAPKSAGEGDADGAFSELKRVNKGLQNYTSGLVSYAKDHFPFRNGFMALDSLYKLGTGNMGANGIILGKDSFLLAEELPAGEEELKQLNKRVFVIRTLCEAGTVPSVVAAAGRGNEVMADKFPAAIDVSPIGERRKAVNDAFEKAFEKDGSKTVYLDLAAVLKEHASEEIYFRTDHHWTALGAFYASEAILDSLGVDPAPLSDYGKEVGLTTFKGTLYNSSGMYFLPGEELFFMRCEGDEDFTVTYMDTNGSVKEVRNSLYDRSCFDENYEGTAYDAFVTTVSVPVVKIEKPGAERETLLVVKDSFAHSALPYLARYFNVISVDLRKNPEYALELIESGEIDRLLVLVNTETLFSEA